MQCDSAPYSLFISHCQPCAPTLPGIVTLVGTYLVDNSRQNAVLVHQRYRHSVWSIAVYKIRRTVQRVDNPYQTARSKFMVIFFLNRYRTLFSNKSSSRQQTTQPFHNKLFRTFVDIRHIVVSMFPLHPVDRKSLALLSNICTSLTGYRANL